MDTDEILLLALAGVVAVYITKKGLFEPEGMTASGLQNTVSRQGETFTGSTRNNAPTIRRYSNMPDRQFITVGNTTYSIRDIDLNQTGFIRRRATLGNITGLDRFNWFNQWVYS